MVYYCLFGEFGRGIGTDLEIKINYLKIAADLDDSDRYYFNKTNTNVKIYL